MLIGLRKAWYNGSLKEEPDAYQARPSSPQPALLFHHESLDVYQVSLAFMRWFVTLPGAPELSDRLCREIDKRGTSVVLNMAEGNGRYSELDRRFLEIAAASAVKAAVYLDLYHSRTLGAAVETSNGQELLGRVLAMLSRF